VAVSAIIHRAKITVIRGTLSIGIEGVLWDRGVIASGQQALVVTT
jgi:hypothetical protein